MEAVKLTLILTFTMFMASCLRLAQLNNDLNEARNLFEYLDEILLDNEGVILIGGKLNFFVLRSVNASKINLYPTFWGRVFSSGEEVTVQFAISRNAVEKRSAKCMISSDYSVNCSVAKNIELLPREAVAKLFDLLKSAKNGGVVLKRPGVII